MEPRPAFEITCRDCGWVGQVPAEGPFGCPHGALAHAVTVRTLPPERTPEELLRAAERDPLAGGLTREVAQG